jgi:HK97 family phage major capsid protein
MNSGDSFEEPFDIQDAEAVWIGELESRDDTETPGLGLLTVPLQEMYAAPKASQKLLDVSYIDIGAWLDGKVNDRFGRSEGIAFVNGDGLKRPRGFLTYETSLLVDTDRNWGQLQYVKTGDANGFKAADPDNQTMPADALKSLFWSLRAPYRSGATFLMNSQTASVIDKFKDAQGNYIWSTGMTAGAQSSLLGYPVEIDENMDDIGANKYPIAFGNFKLGYIIIERPGLKYLRDPYTDKPNVIFYAYRRVGGSVSNFDAIKLLKCAA